MAEDLTEYFTDLGVRVRYLHADVSTLERMDIIRDLRLGEFDVLIGINLLREGLDIPEVSLVAILDADKEGFLRSTRSLIQTFGRAARNLKGKVILYAEGMTRSMESALSETDRRREIQQAYNLVHGIIPATVEKEVTQTFEALNRGPVPTSPAEEVRETPAAFRTLEDVDREIEKLQSAMQHAAAQLAFEEAAVYRDRIGALRRLQVFEL
jgi:excinuclease ABC subunit B